MRALLRLFSFALGTAAIGPILAVSTAVADPMPGYSLDPLELESRMDSCMAYRIGPHEILMGWINIRTGDQRQWRCSSLRHMLLDDEDRPAHDPYENVPDFMQCVDKVVSYGFPRKGDPGNTRLIYQYNGTTNRAEVVVNDATGDIVTIYTSVSNDWTGCANGL